MSVNVLQKDILIALCDPDDDLWLYDKTWHVRCGMVVGQDIRQHVLVGTFLFLSNDSIKRQ